MLSQVSQAILRDFARELEHRDRYIDTGVRIEIVRRGADGKLETIDTKRYGGVIDTAAKPPRIVDDRATEYPTVWQCSEEQWAAIEHPDSDPEGTLLVAGMGSGKTVAVTIWLYLRWQEHIGEGLEGGIVAPTAKRLNLVLREIFNRWPASWWRYVRASNVITLCDGTTLRGVSTTLKSSAAGSPVQGFNWGLGAAIDEIQDCTGQVVNIQMRLRSAANGRAKRIGTATAKDDPAWRDCKESLVSSGVWQLKTLIGPHSPFVHPSHWEALKRMTSDREYRRLVMAEDVPSESRVYHCWSREHNYIPIPLGARKITSRVVAKKIGGEGWGVLIGHDPGQSKSASVWLDCYHVPDRVADMIGAPRGEPIWFCREELLTRGATLEDHVTRAMRITRETFGVNMRPDLERAHVRCQPLGVSEDRPGFDVLSIWRRIGFDARVSQYSKTGAPVGQIKKSSRLEMVNSLLCAADGKRRLFIEQGKCKQLVAALETMERDERGRAEHEAKDEHDMSDLPAAMAYGLHPWCRETATALRLDIKRAIS